jgi:hypothetical protein
MRTEAYKEANLEVFAIPRPIILQSIATGKPMLIHSHCLAAIGLAVIQRRIHTMAHQVAREDREDYGIPGALKSRLLR